MMPLGYALARTSVHHCTAYTTVGCVVAAGEIGDTWVFGVASDPLKTANFRAASRIRAACLAEPACPSMVSGVVFASLWVVGGVMGGRGGGQQGGLQEGVMFVVPVRGAGAHAWRIQRAPQWCVGMCE